MFVSSLEHTYYKIRTSRHPAERKETIFFLAAKNQIYLTLTTETDHHCIDLVASSPSASDESVLECIFEMLHSFIVPERKVLYNKTIDGNLIVEDTSGSYWERMKRLIDNDASLLNRLMMKLAWGNHQIPELKRDAAKAQIYVAAECIRGAREERGSSFGH